jgi:hypothetical protein
MAPPKSAGEWARMLRERFARRNRELGIHSDRATEVFSVTAWGVVPDYEQVVRDFPHVSYEASNLPRLMERLGRWRQA